MLFVGSAAEQDLHHLVAAAAAGQGQGRVFSPLGLCLDVSSVVDQNLHNLVVARRGGQYEGGEALLVPVLDVRAPAEEQVDELLVAPGTRQGQRRVVVTVRLAVQVHHGPSCRTSCSSC